MYKYFEKNGLTIMYYRFDSIYEYVNYLKTAPIMRNVFFDLASNSDDYSFCQTKSFDEAIKLLQYGYHKDFNKVMELKINIEKYIKLSNKKNRQYNNYVGYAPDVKAYLEGSPLSMLNKDNAIRKKIDLYINTSYSAFTSSSKIFNRGAILLTIIEILESLGFSVDLHLFEMCKVDYEIHFSDFIFKKENERMNPQKLFFPLCHPSWVRRLNFRLIEETPDINSAWSCGYGKPCELNDMKRVIDLKSNDIIIPTIQELDIHGRDIISDTNRVFDYINRLSEKDFELNRIEKVKRL